MRYRHVGWPSGWVDSIKAASLLKVAPITMRMWRSYGGGPAFRRFRQNGANKPRIFYKLTTLGEFKAARAKSRKGRK